ncbi:hypothetical protein KNE206_72670 [Kitasatospora sp. NE20-6]
MVGLPRVLPPVRFLPEGSRDRRAVGGFPRVHRPPGSAGTGRGAPVRACRTASAGARAARVQQAADRPSDRREELDR